MDDLISQALQQPHPIYLDKPYVLVSKDQNVLPIADSLASLKDGRGNVTGLVIVFRDITQQLLAQETERAIARSRRLAARMVEMQKINQMREDFLATTSHIMRTPLANIKMAIRLLEISLEQQGILDSTVSSSSHPIGRYLNILNHECDEELALVNDLLELRSLEANPAPLEMNTVQVADWLPHLLEGFQERTQQQQQTLTIDMPPTLPPIITELLSLNRLMSELIHNACKYTPAGGQIVVTSKAITGQSSIPMLLFEICNSGVEITSDDLSCIFKPFYRVTAHDIHQSGGTGLGLTLAKKLVARLQGTLEVSSQDNCTTFRICIPQQLQGDRASDSPSP